jgi:tRNA (guanosine-2'-O-)-methyltransferase
LAAIPQAVLALYIIGCGGAAQTAPRTAGELQRPSGARESSGAQPFSDLRVSPQATPVTMACEYNAYEECNALDDDCNGVIDDQCGYESGAVQITVAWNSGADIDLYVTDPSGATLYYNELHKRSRIGGHLDHDARGDCRKEQPNPRIENAYWPSPLRAGPYRVELHYFSPCAQTAATEATLSVVVRGQLLGAYRVRLEPEQRSEVLSFVAR